MNDRIMCIEYLGTLGAAASVPALNGTRALDIESGRIEIGGASIRAGERRIVAEDLGQQLVDQGNYKARPFLLVVDGGVADGKSKSQVLVFARSANGRPKANIPAVPATKDTLEVPAQTVAITLGAPGSASISEAKQLEPGLFVAMLTAPREPGPVTVHGKVDGDRVALVIDFPPAPAPEVTGKPPAVPAQD